MDVAKVYSEKIDIHRVCVIIPTYNNAKTLGHIISGVSEFTSHIIVVNDGSVDETEQ